MKKIIVSLFTLFILSACGNGLQTVGDGNTSTTGVVVAGGNVMAVHVGCEYINEPCVSVTICVPGTSNCQTIPNVLLDTGSYGLRLFGSVATLALPQVTDASNRALTECTSYIDGKSDWGPVKKADVQMGTETASNIPIQIIDANFGSVPSDCTGVETSTTTAGYNGILGVGLYTEDCGQDCITDANNRLYFACSGTTCVASKASAIQQVSNPVYYLPIDNNGVILQLPAISQSGTANVVGSLILGIGTQANNTPVNVTTFLADNFGAINTVFNGQSYTSSFLDSGSNALSFPGTSATPDCTGSLDGLFCPPSPVNFTAVQKSNLTSSQANVSFQVGNASTEYNPYVTNISYPNYSGSYSQAFDWGLPFFFGRSVYVGINQTSSSLGTGPYWAY